jgi:hypothetical protein
MVALQPLSQVVEEAVRVRFELQRVMGARVLDDNPIEVHKALHETPRARVIDDAIVLGQQKQYWSVDVLGHEPPLS